ncbi:MAG: hypothetical protein RIQ52_134 [Pseudomonadota bacterium]
MPRVSAGYHAHLFPRHPREHLAKLVSLESQDLRAIVAFAIAAGCMALATPVAVQALVNTIAFGILLQPLVVLMLTLLGCLVLSSLLNGLQIFVVEMIQRRLFVRLAGRIADSFIKARLNQHLLDHGTHLANYYFEVMTIQKTWSNLLLDGLAYGLQTVIGLVLLAFYHPALLGFDALIVVCIYTIFRILGTNGIATAVAESEDKYAVAAWIQELPRNAVLMKWGAGSEWAWSRTNTLTENYLKSSQQHFRVVMKQQAAILTLYAFANALLLGLGGWMVIERQLTMGQLVAAELIVSAMLAGLTRLGKTITSYYDLMAGMDKLSYLLDLPNETDGQEPLVFHRDQDRLRIRTQGLMIHADAPEKNTSLRLPDFDITQGSHLIIKAESALQVQGIIETIGTLRNPVNGRIFFNDIASNIITLNTLREQISILLRPEWFESSIIDNIRLGREHINLEQIQDITHQTGLDIVVNKLPDGTRTSLMASGYPLDRHQLFLLSLTRALAGRPRLLLAGNLSDMMDASMLPGMLDILMAPDAPWTLILGTADPRVLEAAKHRGRIIHISTFSQPGDA